MRRKILKINSPVNSLNILGVSLLVILLLITLSTATLAFSGTRLSDGISEKEYAFSGGSFSSTQFDTLQNAVVLNSASSSGTFTSQVFDQGSSSLWQSISWQSNVGQLPDNQQTTPVSSMSGNMLLLHFNEGPSVASFIDNSGNYHHASCTGTGCPISGVAGKFGNAMQFIDDRINTSLLTVPERGTLEFWMKNKADPGRRERILGIADNFEVRMQETGWMGYDVCIGGINQIVASKNNDWIALPWYHLAITWDDTTNEWKSYVNGMLDNNGTSSAITGCTSISGPLSIGTRTGTTEYFNGTLDEVALYNRVLSAAEMQEHYRRGLAQLHFKARSCDDAVCAGESFTDLGETTPQSISVPNSVPNNQYFQYQVDLSRNDVSVNPSLFTTTVTYSCPTCFTPAGVCQQQKDQANCENNRCTWDAAANSCKDPGNRCYSKGDRFICEDSSCTWSRSNGLCEERCKGYTTSTDCKAYDCVWDATVNICKDCSEWNNNPAGCTATNFCSWNTAVKTCNEPASSCSGIRDGPTCRNTNGCVWSDATVSCLDDKIPLCTTQEYTNSPVDTIALDRIIPLGNLAPAGHTLPTEHLYFLLKSSQKYNFKAAGNLYLREIRDEGVSAGLPDYGVYFVLCQLPEGYLSGYFKHLSNLSQELSDKKSQITETNPYVVTVGKIVGTVSGGQERETFDFGTRDGRVKNNFVNPSRYNSGSLTAVCSLDSYGVDDSLRKELYSKVDRVGGQSPMCGEVMQDVEHTLQGNWFYGEASKAYNSADWPKLLALVHDNKNNSKGAISVGGTSMNAALWLFTPEHNGLINREWSEVGDQQTYCYQKENAAERILIQLANTQKDLSFEYQAGKKCVDGGFTFIAPTYYGR